MIARFEEFEEQIDRLEESIQQTNDRLDNISKLLIGIYQILNATLMEEEE